jgi:hypothetical protein
MSNYNYHSSKDVTFKRKSMSTTKVSPAKALFTNHKQLDDFIQNSLDYYGFVDPWQELYDATGIYSKFIISNKSAIPDLVIYNKKFNKNECFYEAGTEEVNNFPR